MDCFELFKYDDGFICCSARIAYLCAILVSLLLELYNPSVNFYERLKFTVPQLSFRTAKKNTKFENYTSVTLKVKEESNKVITVYENTKIIPIEQITFQKRVKVPVYKELRLTDCALLTGTINQISL